MLLYLADALDPQERSEMEAHLASGCPACRQALLEAEAVFAAVGMSLDPQAAPSAIKQHLLWRISPRSALPPPPVAPPPASPGPSPAEFPDNAALRLFRIVVPAAVAAGIALILTHAIMVRRIRSIDDLQQERSAADEMILEQRDQEIARLHHQLDRQQPVITMLQSGSAAVTRLAGKQQPQASAELVWDSHTGQSVLLAHKLDAPPPGRTYELWYITASQKKLPAGTFTVDPNGSATFRTPIPPLSAGKLAAAAVTDEPLGGAEAPTGQIQLVGKIQ